jgi:hypothetical protein
MQKANARPWEQVQLTMWSMPDKRPGAEWAPMELIETLTCCNINDKTILYHKNSNIKYKNI